MGGGDLNLKKSWHPGTFRNQEKVWKQERQAAEEQKKLQQLRKELEEERQIQELQRIQEAAGGKKRQERLDWMYQAPPTGSNKDEAALEDYLLGRRRVDDILNKKTEDMAKLSREADILAKSGPSKANNPRDIQAKIREDPLLAIKRREQAALEAIARNPIKLRQMQEGKDSSSKKKSKKKDTFAIVNGSFIRLSASPLSFSLSITTGRTDKQEDKKVLADTLTIPAARPFTLTTAMVIQWSTRDRSSQRKVKGAITSTTRVENDQSKDDKEAQAAERARRLKAMMDDAAAEEQLRKERLADSEVEETIRRLSAKKNVQGVVIVNQLGLMIRSTLDAALAKQYASLMSELVRMARDSVTQLDAQNELTFLRIRTKKHEIMICPEREYLMIVVQTPEST
ncbi:RNA-splicing factor [Actinomortierella wolfii]|nr:RNA-splicing factor [Actinomortierella wolfii]